MFKTLGTAVLAGILSVGGGKILLVIVVTLLSSLSVHRGMMDALLLGAYSLTNIVGWIPYLIWGGIAGWSLYRLQSPPAKWAALFCCFLMLLLHDILWSRGSGYQVSFDFYKFSILFKSVFWKEAGIRVIVWMVVMIPAFIFLGYNFTRIQQFVQNRIERG